MTFSDIRRTIAACLLAGLGCVLAARGTRADDQPAKPAVASGARSDRAPRGVATDGPAGRVHDWLEQRLQTELEVVARCTDPTPQQHDRLASAAEKCRERAAREFLPQAQSIQQSGALFIRRGGHFQKVAVESLFVDHLSAAIAGELTDAQRASYQREVEARADFWRQANIAAMEVLLDAQLYFSSEQCAAVADQLKQHWQGAAHFDLAAYFTHPRCVPTPLPELLQSILDPSQQLICTTLYTADYWRGSDRRARSPGADEGQWLEEMLLQSNTAAGAFRQALSAQCAARLRQVDAVCALTPDQRKELVLAGRGDVERFMDRAAALRDQLRASDPGRWVRADHDRLLPLQQALSGGLFATDSLFEKVLAHRLSTEQTRRWQQAMQTRAAVEHAAQLRLLVASLTDSVPMLQAQRRQLLELLEQRTQPTAVDRSFARYVLIYHVAAIPSEQLRAIFDAEQMEALARVFRANQSAEIFLRQNGMLPTAEFQDGEDD